MEARKKVAWYPIALAVIFVTIFVFVVLRFLSQASAANDELIAEHIQKLQTIFKNINDTAKINGFRHKKDFIDFLNVRSFEGSVVGPMSLVEPKKWQGPYLNESLTMGGQEYQIVATKKGFYIVPGDGVKLANGKIIGKTLAITSASDIDAMMSDPQALNSKGKILAARIDTVQNPFEALTKSDFLDEEIETIA